MLQPKRMKFRKMHKGRNRGYATGDSVSFGTYGLKSVGRGRMTARQIEAARRADWAPVSFGGQLHDRASYRFFWQVLERAHQTGRPMPGSAQSYFGETPCAV